MKDVIIALTLIAVAWLYAENMKKEAVISNCKSQIAEEDKRTAEATADLRRQLGDVQTELQTTQRQVAQLRAKLPATTWLQDRVEQAKGVLEPAAR